MCFTGGPRCYGDAKGIYQRALKTYEDYPTPGNEAALKLAKAEMMLTPEGIETVRAKDPEKADRMQQVYDYQLEGAKDYERYRSESTRTMDKIKDEQKETATEIAALSEKIQALASSMSNDEIDNANGDYDNMMVPFEYTQEMDQSRYDDLTAKRTELTAKSDLAEARMNTINEANAANLERRKNGQPLQHPHLMPAKFDSYFADTEKKHFNSDSAGSTFSKAKNLNEVLTLASRQRGNLEGDDREKLIARGADPSSFDSAKRYLMVATNGKLGTVMASQLDDSTMVRVVQKSEKTKPVCVVETTSKRDVDFATVVLVDNPTMPGTENHASLLITAFPGASGPSGSSNDLLPHVGKNITVAEAKQIFGRDFTINTILSRKIAEKIASRQDA